MKFCACWFVAGVVVSFFGKFLEMFALDKCYFFVAALGGVDLDLVLRHFRYAEYRF